MRLAIVGENSDVHKQYVNVLKKKICNINNCFIEDISFYDKNMVVLRELNEYDIVITLDLAGFEKCTLTEGLSYNLINSKFVNLLLHENLQNEKMLNKPLSISMFFYCVGKEYYNYLLSSYPNIPYLRELIYWDNNYKEALKNNVACIVSVVEEVVKECI